MKNIPRSVLFTALAGVLLFLAGDLYTSFGFLVCAAGGFTLLASWLLALMHFSRSENQKNRKTRSRSRSSSSHACARRAPHLRARPGTEAGQPRTVRRFDGGRFRGNAEKGRQPRRQFQNHFRQTDVSAHNNTSIIFRRENHEQVSDHRQRRFL